MYLKLFHATEDAINRLIAAQRECEELYAEREQAMPQPFDNSHDNSELIDSPAK